MLDEGFLYCRLLLMVMIFTLWGTFIFKICCHSGNFWTCHHPAMQCPRIFCQVNCSTRCFDECLDVLVAVVSCNSRKRVNCFMHRKLHGTELLLDSWMCIREDHHVMGMQILQSKSPLTFAIYPVYCPFLVRYSKILLQTDTYGHKARAERVNDFIRTKLQF